MGASETVIEVVVNKSWEFEPFFNAMTNKKLKPEGFPLPDVVNNPEQAQVMYEPRAVYNGFKNFTVVLRCIENMMDPEKNPSCSEAKMEYMPDIIAGDNPAMVISVSTAESTPDTQPGGDESVNGSVYIGGNFFMFDARQYNPEQPSPSQLEVIPWQNDSVPTGIYKMVDAQFQSTVIPKFIPSAFSRAGDMYCIADKTFVSIGVVNIVDYAGYSQGDPAAVNDYNLNYAAKTGCIPASIETTHGIVKMAVNKAMPGMYIPTLFVSPITDRYEHFDDDVDKNGVQNYVTAFNAGIVVAELIKRIDDFLDTGMPLWH